MYSYSFLLLSLLLLIYTYIGYTPLLSLLKRFHKQPQKSVKAPLPSMTLIIPLYNEESVVVEKVINTLTLHYTNHQFEILFIDDGSNDSSLALLQQLSQHYPTAFKIISMGKNGGKYRAICKGVALAQHEIVAVADCSSILDQFALEEIGKCFLNPKVGAASSHYKIPLHKMENSITQAESDYFCYENSLKKLEHESGSLIVVQGALYAFRKNLFIAKEKRIINDDLYIPCQILEQGYSVAYAEKAFVYEKNRTTESAEFFKRVRIATGNIQCLMDHPFLLLPTHAGRRITAIKLTTHKLLRLCSPLLLLIAYTTSVLCFFKVEHPPLTIVVIFFLQHLFYLLALLGLLGLLLGHFINKRHLKLIGGKFFYRPYYFTLCNAAIFWAILKYPFTGRMISWNYALLKSEHEQNLRIS
ncbi:MAG: glycosyltransferase [Oligoflexia bacterium]|nr:glycosyltransferase [Oligoflexia bacterium]MBF0365688.1 glycosyltransferase [Oligoflexia bacterium]